MHGPFALACLQPLLTSCCSMHTRLQHAHQVAAATVPVANLCRMRIENLILDGQVNPLNHSEVSYFNFCFLV